MADLTPWKQTSLLDSSPVSDAVATLAAGGIDERGAIYTRREVVEFILDLSGYTSKRPLHRFRLLEPSFGEGDFLEVVIGRLLESWRASDLSEDPFSALAPCIRGVELHHSSFESTRDKVIEWLGEEAGIAAGTAGRLADAWLVQGDFLLVDLNGPFDFVIGNPPYVRQELIPDILITEYRTRYRTVFDRADIYIPFIERSLSLLGEGGTLGFICADRWMKNRYGGPLRRMVAEGYHLKAYVDMTDTPAFHSDVIAYPAITVITREKPCKTRIAHRPDIDKSILESLARDMLTERPPAANGAVKEMADVAVGAQPWILESPDRLGLIRKLEQEFPAIEKVGCKVGIGVATGADKAFIGSFNDLDVEDDRKLPLAMTRDIVSGEVKWRGLGLVNPFADGGGLVDLDEYPRLKYYLEERREQIEKRHVAQKAPANWYRTIDRIYPALASRPKLLVPDIKGEAHIVYEDGHLYPHHNLYFIISDEWDLRALRAVLRSGIARLFVSMYATRMRGGYFRFQAQYLRRIRLPRWQDVSASFRADLIELDMYDNPDTCRRVVSEIYGLTKKEYAAIGEAGDRGARYGN